MTKVHFIFSETLVIVNTRRVFKKRIFFFDILRDSFTYLRKLNKNGTINFFYNFPHEV